MVKANDVGITEVDDTMINTLYKKEHPLIHITHDTDTGDITLIRGDEYMSNPDGDKPSFVPLHKVLINVEVWNIPDGV